MGIQWERLPQPLRDDVETHLGPVIKTTPVRGHAAGAGIRLLHESRRSTWLKACPARHPIARVYERERQVGLVLPVAVPTPRMQWSSTDHGWIAMAHPFIDGRAADLSPGSPDVRKALETVACLGDLLTPGPPGVPLLSDHVGGLLGKAHAILDDQSVMPAGDRAMYAELLDGFDVGALEDSTLLHFALHPGALRVVEPNGVSPSMFVFGWGAACQGPPWVEFAMFAPWLISAGHTVRRTESLLANLAVWQAAPGDQVTRLIALWTLFRLYKAAHAPESSQAAFQHAARSGRSWLRHRIT
ncbi:hypothetical protein C1I98_28590 [Spongiactinospora gelatinilytica]|uniref:Aminoglycoside phosphotransferase domain-containing protein n=1 Tax=Spongiactinospora gelatinilytica TaxID=2666298 RepID=A0A2W2FUD7_9ACTN|nr:hypothetical protein [Spongiactinospora gelatinilytica]PZG33719.1 hypothetical protein C1I98_28590 [Spongiactinospora gelatinilytica]